MHCILYKVQLFHDDLESFSRAREKRVKVENKGGKRWEIRRKGRKIDGRDEKFISELETYKIFGDLVLSETLMFCRVT